MTAEDSQLRAETWTYIGRRLTAKGKLAYAWLDERQELHLYAKQNASHAPIGSAYTVHVDDTSIVVKGADAPRYQSQDRDHPDFLEWVARDHAAEYRAAADKQAKRAQDADPIRAALLPLRQRAHGRLSSADKSALANAILAEYWRPLTNAEKAAQ